MVAEFGANALHGSPSRDALRTISPSLYQLGGWWCALSATGPPLEFGAYTGSVALRIIWREEMTTRAHGAQPAAQMLPDKDVVRVKALQ
jgi:hypothetical protein